MLNITDRPTNRQTKWVESRRIWLHWQYSRLDAYHSFQVLFEVRSGWWQNWTTWWVFNSGTVSFPVPQSCTHRSWIRCRDKLSYENSQVAFCFDQYVVNLMRHFEKYHYLIINPHLSRALFLEPRKHHYLFINPYFTGLSFVDQS